MGVYYIFMIESDFNIKTFDPSIYNIQFGDFNIIEPYKYQQHVQDKFYVKCKCACGNIFFKQLSKISRHIAIRCSHSLNNNFYIINDDISFIKIFDYKTFEWNNVLVNTECLEKLKHFTWRIVYHSTGRIDIISSYGDILSRTIVSYINSKYNLPPLTDDLIVDHISGNTFNNLYYPFNDYYNNLRVCTDRQNCLNKPSKGYIYRPNHSINKPFYSNVTINGNQIHKSFHTPQECINYNISQLSDIDKPFYYHSPSNPRNNPNTFSNTILNAIGYNDNEYEYTDDDFNDGE